MIKMMLNKWISIPTLGMVLLSIIQAGHSLYMDKQVEAYVSRIEGVQVGELTDEGVNIRWADNTDPPACPVSLEFVWEHEDGYAFAELPPVHFTALEHAAVAKSKSGHISLEPIPEEYIGMLRAIPGEWHYKILFKFDCALVSSPYLSWITSNGIHVIKPVIINVN